MRFRTTAGHQIILDDTNERIYVSTAKGKSWIELDENGTINVYSDSKLNITGNNDVNIHSNENLNLSAAKRVNIVSEQGSIQLSANKLLIILFSIMSGTHSNPFSRKNLRLGCWRP
jgi:uncharacterized protein (DUF2345 family)